MSIFPSHNWKREDFTTVQVADLSAELQNCCLQHKVTLNFYIGLPIYAAEEKVLQ